MVLISHSKKYTIKERLFMSVSWMPRSSVPATLGGVLYAEAKSRGPKYAEY